MKFFELKANTLYCAIYQDLEIFFVTKIREDFNGELYVQSLAFEKKKNATPMLIKLNETVFGQADKVREGNDKEITKLGLRDLL